MGTAVQCPINRSTYNSTVKLQKMFDLAKLFINRAVCWVESGFLSQKKRNFASSKNQKISCYENENKGYFNH